MPQGKKFPSGAWFDSVNDGTAHILPGMDKALYEKTMALLECEFDTAMDIQEAEARYMMALRRHTVAMAWIKTLLFVPEYILTIMFRGQRDADALYQMQRLYWSYLRGKVDEQYLAEAQHVLSLELAERLKEF